MRLTFVGGPCDFQVVESDLQSNLNGAVPRLQIGIKGTGLQVQEAISHYSGSSSRGERCVRQGGRESGEVRSNGGDVPALHGDRRGSGEGGGSDGKESEDSDHLAREGVKRGG